jgi:hypothetical protein
MPVEIVRDDTGRIKGLKYGPFVGTAVSAS